MIEYLNTHQYAFWFTTGFVLLAVDALVFGFTSGLVLFTGIGALLTGGLMWAEVVPQTWLYGIACFGILSSASAALLWKALLKLQNFDVPAKDNSSDLVGHTFRLTDAVTLTQPGSIHYSGIDWRVEIDDRTDIEQIEAGAKVVVTSVDAGVFRVSPAAT